MPRIVNAFRFNAKHAFLTYAQCPLTKEVALELVKGKLGDNLKSYIIAEELHADGSPHLHMLLSGDNKWDTLLCTFFDIGLDPVYHPNIVSPANLKKCKEYVKKGRNFIESDPEKELESVWSKIVEDSATAEEFMKNVRMHDPKNYVLNYERLEYYTNKHYIPPVVPYVADPNEEFLLPADLSNWLATEFVSSYISCDLRPAFFSFFFTYFVFFYGQIDFEGTEAPQDTSVDLPDTIWQDPVGEKPGPPHFLEWFGEPYDFSGGSAVCRIRRCGF